jgi:transcription elongation GreA/GreB family factor
VPHGATLDCVSKAFTREGDDAGIEPAPSRAFVGVPFRLTHAGARKLKAAGDAHSLEALRHAELVEMRGTPDRAVLGASVEVLDDHGARHVYRLVSAEERALLGEGCSVESPVGRALLGATPGEVREANVPRGTVELEIIALRGESEGD